MTHPSPASAQDAANVRPIRQDGWTPDRRRSFLEAVAEGHTVERACRLVGLSVASAYALRQRACGADFALGWQAASLMARDRIADDLLARAIDGQVETTTRPDGSTVSRHRYDNRLAHSMLTRLDKLADASQGDGSYHAARLIAGEFDQFLDLIEADHGPVRTGMFVGLRAAAQGIDPDVTAIAGLARADRYLRTGQGLAAEVDTHDLDPAARANWTADQWARAEASGLLSFAPAPVETAPEPQLPQPGVDDDPVWWCPEALAWRTSFPPSGDFIGWESGEFGDDDYERALSEDEEEIVEEPHQIAIAVRAVTEGRERDAFFAALRTDQAERDEHEDEDEPDEAPDLANPAAADMGDPVAGGPTPACLPPAPSPHPTDALDRAVLVL